MEAPIARPGKIDWKSLLARCSKRRVGNLDRVSGLVVSIGVHCDRGGPVPGRIVNFLESLRESGDFAERWGEDEFLLICPEERGASVQRRLARISRELWDFQLGSLGDFEILFSWGGVEVQDEPVADAIALATMRMQETRRARKSLM